MKTMKKVLAMLLTVCMAVGCMTVGALATGSVTKSAFGQSRYPTVSGNYADNVYATASVDVGDTVTDSGKLVLYSNYGLCTVTNWDNIGVTNVKSNNPAVATAEITHSGSNLSVVITGVADGTATITVDYAAKATINADQIYSNMGEIVVANGYIYYTVTVGTGSSTPSTPGGDTGDDGDWEPNAKGWYAIHNVQELLAVADDMTAKYYLANDIDLSDYEGEKNGNWTPLGWTNSDDVPFTGIFDGRGKKISGYDSIWRGTNVGLFAINNGTIRNLYLEYDEVEGNAYVGALCGENNGTIDFVHVSGRTVGALNSSGAAPVGALVGKNGADGTITRCSAKANNVYGYNYVGGLVGQNYGEITASKSNASVNTDLTTTSASRYYAGGLVGGNVGDITDCYSHGNTVSGTEKMGGFAGFNGSGGTVTNSYANTKLSVGGTTEVTGDIGKNSGSVSNCLTANSYREHFTAVSSWEDIQSKLNNTGNWALNTKNPVLLKWEVEGYGELEDVGENDTTEYDVTYAKGSVKTGDTVNLPADQTVAAGTTIYLGTPTRTNAKAWVYQFCGWTCNKDSSTYMTGAPYEVNSDVTFTATWKLASVDGDAVWDHVDAMAIMDHLAGNITLTDEQLEVADFNNDGDVDHVDAMAIMDMLAGNV